MNKLKKFRQDYETAVSKIWEVIGNEKHPLYKITKWLLQTDASAEQLFPELEYDAFSSPENFAAMLELLAKETIVVSVNGELRIVFCDNKEYFENNKEIIALTELELLSEPEFSISVVDITLDEFGAEYDRRFVAQIDNWFDNDLQFSFMPLKDLLDYYSKTFKLFDRSKYE